MSQTALEQTIRVLFEKKRFNTLRDILITLNPADLAVLFEELPQETHPLLFRLLPKELAAEMFVEMESDSQEYLIRSFSDKELREIISELYMDDAVDLIEEMPANVVKRILQQADPETRRSINQLLQYPDDSAGSIMTTEFVDLRPTMNVMEAVQHIRKTGVDKETINTCYVTDKGRHLLGTVSIRTIILSGEDQTMEEIMEPRVISVYTQEDQEHVAAMFSKYDFTSMPVVDAENRMVGIVTVDDAMDVMQAEATEDIEKMSAMTPSTRPYIRTGVFEIWKSRIPWLIILMFLATFTGLIINHFEDALAAQTALIAFIPMLMGTGGNAGNQASVSIIRSLTLGELEFSDFLRVIWKEFRVSLLTGIALAICSFAKLILLDGATAAVSLVVSLSLAVTVLAAKLVGAGLPMLAKKIGLDPAVMASPFITTIVDVLSMVIYLCFAISVLGL